MNKRFALLMALMAVAASAGVGLMKTRVKDTAG